VQVRVTARRPRGRLGTSPDTVLAGGSGSGFFIDGEGHLLTNYHVIHEAERVAVTLSDGRDFEAAVIGADPNTDIAVLRVDAGGGTLPFADLGDSDAIAIGDWVIALGNPLGLRFSVTAGVISALDRQTGILRNGDNTQLEAFIQTDAAINPGNSGGPLVDLQGRVVGINTAIETQTGLFSGTSFAVPINLAAKVASDLIRYGVVHRPRIGVALQDVNSADAELYGLEEISGAEIVQVDPNMPGAEAGLQLGDVVVMLDGVPIRTVAELQTRIARFQPGDRPTLGIIRYGEPMEKVVKLGEFEGAARVAVAAPPERSGRDLLGFTYGAVTGRRVGAFDDAAVEITGVEPFGPAAEQIGPATGVRILSVNGEDIREPAQLDRIADALRPGQLVSLVILRAAGVPPTIYNYRAR
jgi:serine protease Do